MNRIYQAVEKHRDRILKAERYLWANPETGYKEFKSSRYMEEQFRALGYEPVLAEGITGFYTVLDTGRPGPEVMILAELDSIICPAHQEADPTTGAVHSCGHHAQCATLLGIAAALKEEGMLDDLSGRIRLCVVPAEELLEIEYRMSLMQAGKIKYFGGKPEFLHRGYFDGVDVAFMVHTSGQYGVSVGAVGCIAKKITYKGKAAHAGGSPWKGRNALYAANCGLNAVNAIRETFREADLIRVHPIMTAGGDMVNAIPETVTLESYVRGATFEGIADANKKVNRALIGAALSLGTNVEIVDMPGYAPLHNDVGMIEVAREAYAVICPEDAELFQPAPMRTGSTDMGDLSCVMPVIHPYCGGAAGTSHGNDYTIVDTEQACILNAKWQLIMLHTLLKNGGARAAKIKADFKPLFASKEEYLHYVDQIHRAGDCIVYGEDGTATVQL